MNAVETLRLALASDPTDALSWDALADAVEEIGGRDPVYRGYRPARYRQLASVLRAGGIAFDGGPSSQFEMTDGFWMFATEMMRVTRTYTPQLRVTPSVAARADNQCEFYNVYRVGVKCDHQRIEVQTSKPIYPRFFIAGHRLRSSTSWKTEILTFYMRPEMILRLLKTKGDDE